MKRRTLQMAWVARRMILLPGLLLLLTGIVAAAQDQPAARIYVEFSGGAVDSDIAAVIEAFSGETRILPTRRYVPEQTTGLCPILGSELKVAPEFCTAKIIAAIRMLNERHGAIISPDAINVRQGVLLPDVKMTVTEIERVYNLSQQQEAQRLQQLENNPSWRGTIEKKETDLLARQDKGDMSLPQLDQLTFKRIGWEFGVVNPDNIAEAEFLSRQLSGRNLSVDVERSGGFNKAAHSPSGYSALAHYERWCVDQNTSDAEGAFADLAGSLYDTTAAIACESEHPSRPEVVIMDQAIIAHPDLAAALSSPMAAVPIQPQQACVHRTFDRQVDHGTLLSTIVAASDNGYGFRGIAPNATIKSFVWDQMSVTNTDLKLFIRRVLKPIEAQVYLFASEFAPYPVYPDAAATEPEIKAAKQIWRRTANGKWLDLLANDTVRLTDGLAREVLQSPLLLVVSAGQAGEQDEGREITWETPMAPQNLGDHDKVLVVAACTDCDKPTAELWAPSNRGNESRRFVGVMAPGGDDVPTYVSDHEVDRVQGGTSAAAAFVAGLAAEMSSCYPTSYNARPEQLKERIILASRPVNGETTINHVGGGVADPDVSMLDPRRTWLKLKDTPVRPVEFVRWCSERLKFAVDQDGPRDSLNLLTTRRLTNADGMGIVQQSVLQSPDTDQYIKHEVRREAPGKPASQGSVAVVRYSADAPECAVSISRMTDLFLSQESGSSGDCAAIPLCE